MEKICFSVIYLLWSKSFLVIGDIGCRFDVVGCIAVDVGYIFNDVGYMLYLTM